MGVADERREGCDGCDRAVALTDLTTVSMPDGTRLACCPQCVPHARVAADKLAELDTNTDACDGCDDTFKTADLQDVVLTDGTVITVCPTCLAEVPGRSSVGDGPGGFASTEIARRKNLCSHCHEWVEAERFHVTVLDGRTEELCPDCKDAAVDEGVVTDVKMRRVEAREILDVDDDAEDEEIRQAFLTQVKHAHPDRDTGSRAAFRLVKDAYDRLS